MIKKKKNFDLNEKIFRGIKTVKNTVCAIIFHWFCNLLFPEPFLYLDSSNMINYRQITDHVIKQSLP